MKSNFTILFIQSKTAFSYFVTIEFPVNLHLIIGPFAIELIIKQEELDSLKYNSI